ncbi:MAG: Gldg family protein [Tepidisphaeraceae bacterium]
MAEQPSHDSQKERWIKYGLNVLVATIVVILLAGVLVYLAQRTGRRIDTTASGAYSLKPQTVNLIRDLKGKTKLVSLYAAKDARQKDNPYAEPVADLLEEYRRKGSNIEVQTIDPVTDPRKVDDLIGEAIAKYGGAVESYKKFVTDYDKTYEQIHKLFATEAAAVAKLAADKLGQSDRDADIASVINTIQRRPARMDSRKEAIDRELKNRHPDYKKVTDAIKSSMEAIVQTQDQLVAFADQYKADKAIPPEIAAYLTESVPRHKELKARADAVIKQIGTLGDLRVGELQDAVKGEDLILVLGDKDWRVLSRGQVWKTDDAQLRQLMPGQELKPRFAGEQEITTAIHALNQEKKPRVVFVRTGGPPLAAAPMGPLGGGGYMSHVADRLRQYNFEVLDKDLSGMWAMQAQMRQMPTAPEASDEQLKDSVWVVVNMPMGQQDPRMPPPTIAPKVADHLSTGGSAIILFAPQTDAMTDALKPWGIEVRTDAVAVHEMIRQGEGRQGDQIEDALRYPFVFDIRNYGDHPITRPLQSLSSWLVPTLVVKPTKDVPAGVKVTPIIAVPSEPKSWGETDIQALQELSDFKFDEKTDVAGPMWAGAVAEKEKGGRLVVIASPIFAFDRYTDPYQSPDPKLLQLRILASRFPANAELFTNSIFWLAKMEPMIAISPAAMQVARIEPIGEGALRFWKVGGLLVGLPGLVVLAGAMVYFARRD